MDELEFNTVSLCGDGACVELAFHKSSECSDSACAEVAIAETAVYMRNNTDPTNMVTFGFEMWRDLRAGILAGEFNIESAPK